MTVYNTNNILSISTEQPIHKIMVYNSNGTLVAKEKYNGTANEESISLESQSTGVYLIKVETSDGIKTSKIIIK